VYAALRRAGWEARILDSPAPADILEQAWGVVLTVDDLPAPARIDRRLLVPTEPHALDDGTPLAGLVLALLVAMGRIPASLRSKPRAAWDHVGVDCDDVIGGLTTIGIAPLGWHVPAGVMVTIPPRELARCEWPAPEQPNAYIFVTENPSVIAAAADDPAAGNFRLICTVGTPSSLEIASLATLASAGWQVAVRADFDSAGLTHVTALLDGIPGAIPWRMGESDYLKALGDSERTEHQGAYPETHWASALAATMRQYGRDAYEEPLIPELLVDLRHAAPQRRAASEHGGSETPPNAVADLL